MAKATITPAFSFFFQAAYQSTDESDAEDVLDPDTDTEKADETPAQATRKPWISRAPTYRDDVVSVETYIQRPIIDLHLFQFQTGVEQLEALVIEMRDQYTRDNRGKTAAHPRIRGPPKDVRLPYLGAANDKKILRSAVNTAWLLDHPDDDTPSRIQEEEPDEEEEINIDDEVD